MDVLPNININLSHAILFHTSSKQLRPALVVVFSFKPFFKPEVTIIPIKSNNSAQTLLVLRAPAASSPAGHSSVIGEFSV